MRRQLQIIQRTIVVIGFPPRVLDDPAVRAHGDQPYTGHVPLAPKPLMKALQPGQDPSNKFTIAVSLDHALHAPSEDRDLENAVVPEEPS